MGKNNNKPTSKRKGNKRYEDTKRTNSGERTDPRFTKQSNDVSIPGDNHPEWYITSDAHAASVASLPFGKPAGLPIDLVGNQPIFNYSADDVRLPGVGVIGYIPTLGSTGTNAYVAPMNMAAQAAYTTIRRNNAGAKNYEPADLAMYLGAMDSIYQAYYIGERVYKSIFVSNVLNRNYPRLLVEAQGFDYDDLKDHIADFRAYLMHIRNLIQQMAVPNHFSLFARHEFITRNVFIDDGLNKGQVFILKPQGLYQYEATTSSTGSKLNLVNFAHVNEGDLYDARFTFSDYMSYTDNLVNRVVSDIDCAIMSGDIVKAYPNNLYTLAAFNPEEDLKAMHDPRFLIQIHNAVLHGNILEAYIDQVIPELNAGAPYIDTHYVAYGPGVDKTKSLILDIPTDTPTYKDVVSATRLMSGWGNTYNIDDDRVPAETTVHDVGDCGSEICTNLILYSVSNTYPYSKISEFQSWNFLGAFTLDATNNATYVVDLNDLARRIMTEMDIQQMDWAPFRFYTAYLNSDSGAAPGWTSFGVIGKYSNPTEFNVNSQLPPINNMAWSKMLAIDIPPK